MRRAEARRSSGASREAAEILQIDELLDRRPGQLSGGQRQRVAIGRAIVREPQIFLFDEPLSNLDAELRVQMRVEINKLHRRLGVTMIFVTHDQVEAMTLADRIVVLRAGVIEQVGTPLELYNHPANLFVAGFIGSPRMNFLAGEVGSGAERRDRSVRGKSGHRLALPAPTPPQPRRSVTVGVRPEHLEIVDAGKGMLTGEVQIAEHLGGETFRLCRACLRRDAVVEIQGQARIRPGERVGIDVDMAGMPRLRQQWRRHRRPQQAANAARSRPTAAWPGDRRQSDRRQPRAGGRHDARMARTRDAARRVAAPHSGAEKPVKNRRGSSVSGATRDPERTRAAILVAATREFAAEGFGGARVDAIAARRADQQAHALPLFRQQGGPLPCGAGGNLLAASAAPSASCISKTCRPTRASAKLVSFTWNYFLKHPEFLSLLNTENLMQARQLRRSKRIRELHSPLVGLIAELLARGARQGVFRSGRRSGAALCLDRLDGLLLPVEPLDAVDHLRPRPPRRRGAEGSAATTSSRSCSAISGRDGERPVRAGLAGTLPP